MSLHEYNSLSKLNNSIHSKFVTIKENFGSRVLGEKVHNIMLLPVIQGNEKCLT